jgi:hypothetical protein
MSSKGFLMLRERAPSTSPFVAPAEWGWYNASSRLFMMLETRSVAAAL